MRKTQQTRAPRAHRFAVLALAALAALALAVPASAGHKAPATPGVQAPSNGLMVAIDPATGKLRQPTAAEALALSAQTPLMTKAAITGSEVTTFADGTTSAVLGPEFLNVWLVQVNPDGSLSQACVDGASLGTAQPATAALEEK